MDNYYLPASGIIREIRPESENTRTFFIELVDQTEPFHYDPGQFNELSVVGVGEFPVTIGAALDGGRGVRHTVRNVGSTTSKLFELREGDLVGLRGPFGRGWPLKEAEGGDLLLVAGGLGLAPLRSVVETLIESRERFARVNLAYGAKTPGDMVFVSEFDRWRTIPDFEMFLTVDRVSPAEKWGHGTGVVTNTFDRLTVDPAKATVLACGPEIMMRFVANSLLIRGAREDNLFVSMERRMKCGMGKCGHCMIGPAYVCADGPVFSYSEVKELPHNLIAGGGLAA